MRWLYRIRSDVCLKRRRWIKTSVVRLVVPELTREPVIMEFFDLQALYYLFTSSLDTVGGNSDLITHAERLDAVLMARKPGKVFTRTYVEWQLKSLGVPLK